MSKIEFMTNHDGSTLWMTGMRIFDQAGTMIHSVKGNDPETAKLEVILAKGEKIVSAAVNSAISSKG